MKVSLIAAMTKDGVIGLDNRLPWHLPEDLKRFRKITMGKPIVMGRKTFESLPGHLDGRINIVLSRDPDYQPKACTLYHTLSDALASLHGYDEVMIIGGHSLYKQCLPLADTLYLTLIDSEIKGDTFFPEIDWEQWTIIDRLDFDVTDVRPFPFSFVTLAKQP